MSRTAGTFLLSFSRSFSRRWRRREMVVSSVEGLEGGVGSPVQAVSPVRR